MVHPRQSNSRQRINAVWLMNAATLAIAIGTLGGLPMTNDGTALANHKAKTFSLIPEAKAVNYFYVGTGAIDMKASTGFWYTGFTSADGATVSSTTALNVGATALTDNLYFGTSSYTSIAIGTSNRSFGSIIFNSGASAYTFSANSGRKSDLGNPGGTGIINNSSNTQIFSTNFNSQGGSNAALAVTINQATSNGSLVFNGTRPGVSYIINYNAYDYALAGFAGAANTVPAAAGLYGQTQGASAFALSVNATRDGYIKFVGSGTITINGSIDNANRTQGGSGTASLGSVKGDGYVIITNTGTTILNGFNTYTGTTTIGDGATQGGTVRIGNAYAFGGNRLNDPNGPTGTQSGTAYTAAAGGSTIATGWVNVTKAYGAVTVNNGFTVNLNGVTMIGANALTLNGTGASASAGGALINSNATAATYVGAVTLGSDSAINAGSGNITLSGGLNISTYTLTVNGGFNTFLPSSLSGSGTINKSGSGVLTLSGTNSSYSGLFNIDQGILDISAATFGGVVTPTFGTNIANAPTFRINGRNTSVGELSATNTGAIIENNNASAALFTVNNATDTTYAGIIRNGTAGGALSLNKSGVGTLTLSGTNTYTGDTNINAGTLSTANGSLSGSSNVNVNGAILSAANLKSGGNLTVDATGTATISGTNQSIGTLSNANTATNAVNFTGGTGIVTVSTLSGSGNTRFGSNAVITNGISTGTVSVSGNLTAAISGGTVTVTGTSSGPISGNAIVDITGAADGAITGGTNTLRGTLGANLTANVSGGTTTVTGAATVSTLSGASTSLTLNGTGNTISTVNANGTSTLTLGGTTTITTLTATGSGGLNVNADTTIDILNGGNVAVGTGSALTVNTATFFAGAISGLGSVKSGSGVAEFTAANSYTGGTTINSGTVKLSSSGALSTGTVAIGGGTLVVSNGAVNSSGNSTLVGTANAIGGSVNLASGTIDATLGSLTIGGNFTTSGGQINYKLGSTIAVTGALTASNTTTINLSGIYSLGTYTVLSFDSASSSIAANAFNFNAPTGIKGKSFTASTATAGQYNIIVSLSSFNLLWNLGTGGAWDTSTQNWLNVADSTSKAFLPDDSVTFSNSLGGTITIAANVSPSDVIVKAESGTYTFSGAAGIDGSTGITKSQNGRLEITNANTYTGVTSILGGVIVISNANALGGIGSTANTVVSTGAALEISGSITTAAETLTLAGSGILSGGALRNTSGDNIFAGDITLTAAASISSDTNTLTLTGGLTNAAYLLTISGAGNTTFTTTKITGTGGLTKTGNGTLSLNFANDYSGVTTLNGGVMNTSSGALGSTSGVVVNGGTLNAVNYNTAATLSVSNGATANISGTGLSLNGTVTNLGILNFTGNSGTITLAELLGSGTTVFTNNAIITSGISVGNITVTGALNNTPISGGTVSADTLGVTTASTISGGTTTIAGAVNVTTMSSGALTANSSSTITTISGGTFISSTNAAATITSITGGTLTLHGSGNTITTVNSSGISTLTLGGTTTITTLTSAGSGQVNVNANTAVTNLNGGDVVIGSGKILTVSAGTSAGNISGTGSLVKSGAGTLTLAGTNTFSGGLTVNLGTLKVGSATGLGASNNAVTVVSGAVLDLNGSTMTNTNALSIAGTGALVNTSTSAGTYAGNVTLAANLSVVSTGAITLSGTTNLNSFGLTLTGGAGDITLSNTLSGTGGLTINPNGLGNVNISGNIGIVGALTVVGTGGTSNNINITGNIESTVSGITLGAASGQTGQTLLLGGNNTFVGPVNVVSGTLKLGSANALGNVANVTNVNSSGFSAFDLNGQNISSNYTVNITGTGIGGTGAFVNKSTTAATFAGSAVVGGTTTLGAVSGDINLTGALQTTGSTTRAITFSGNTSAVTNINIASGVIKSSPGLFTVTIGGTGTDKVLVNLMGTQPGIVTFSTLKIAGGTVKLASGSTLSPTLVINSGGSNNDTSTLLLTAGDNYTFSALGVGGSLTIDSTDVTQATGITFTNNVTGANGQTGSSSKRFQVNAGITATMNGVFDLVTTSATSDKIFDLRGAGNMVFNAVLQNGAGSFKGGLNKSGAGTVTLNGANTYTGGVILGAGILNLGGAESAGVSGPLGVSGILTLNGGTLQYSALNQYDYSSRFSTAVLQKYNVDTNGQDVSWNTALTSSTGSLAKSGLGKLTLLGANTFTGATTLSAGIINLGIGQNSTISGPLGTNGVINLNGGTLQYSAANQYDYSSRFSSSAAQKYNVDTNGQNISWTASLGNTSSSAAGSLTKSGNGILSLSGANTYTGDTTITAGELKADVANTFSANSVLVLSTGTTVNLNNTTQTVKGLTGAGGTLALGAGGLTFGDNVDRTFAGDISGTGSLTKNGTGNQIFSSGLTYTGTTAINDGTLTVNGALASTTLTLATGATLAGQGNLTGTVTVSNSATITSGDSTLSDANRGGLTIAGLIFNGSATINLANLSSANASNLVTTTLSALGAAGTVTINITNASTLDSTNYNLIYYGTFNPLQFDAFTLGTVTNTSARQQISLVNDLVGKAIQLSVVGDTIKWQGAVNSNWTTALGNSNWVLASSSNSSTDYLSGDVITFDDSASSYTLAIAEVVTPGTLTFNNTTAYIINSAEGTSFGIEGGAVLNKDGAGRLDINAPFKTTGGLIINEGTVALNNAGNTFTGNIELNGSANLEAGATGALGSSNTLTFGAGASGKLSLNGNNATLVGLSNDLNNVGSPVIENGSATTNSTLTLNIATGTSTFDGILQNGSTGTLQLTKTGSGTQILTADNTLTGLTTISGGTLQLGNGGSTGIVGGNTFIDSLGTLNLFRTGDFDTSSVFSGSGKINLQNGNLKLLATNSFSGLLTIYSGSTFTVGSSGSISGSATYVNNGVFDYASTAAYSLGGISGTGSLQISNGAVSQTGVNSLTGALTISAGSTYLLTSTGSFSSLSGITNDGTLSIGAHNDYTINQFITGSGNLISNIGAGKTLTLTKNNNYLGTTTITSGILNVGNGTSSGALGAGNVTINSGAELILANSQGFTLNQNISGAGNLTLGAAGQVISTTDNQINITGELKFGATPASTIHSSLDLTLASATAGSLKVQTDGIANSGVNTITIGDGKSLNIMGAVTIGANNASNLTTNLTMSGAGTFNVGTLSSTTPINVNVGASTTTSKINYVTWDMSGLNTLNMYLNTGTFNVGADVNLAGGTGGVGSGNTVKLAVNTTIVGSTILMDAPESGKTFNLILGSGVNTFNVDTLTVSGANTRATSILNFNTADGSLILRDHLSTGRVALTVQASANSSGSTQTGSVDLTGHLADLYLGAVTVGSRTSTGNGNGSGAGSLKFDTGTFDATSLTIATKAHNGTLSTSAASVYDGTSITGNVIGMVSLGGGTVVVGQVDLARHTATNLGGVSQGLLEFYASNTSTVGAVTMATALSVLSSTTPLPGNPSAKGILNISGGDVTIASIAGASAAANTSATAEINLKDGKLTMGGNITRVGGAGTSAFNFNLNGATAILDMGGHSLGSSTAAINFNWTTGTLKNVSGLNGTQGITINTNDIFTPVYLAGTNTFTSKITIKDSVLQIESNTALGASSQIGFDGTSGTLKYGTGVSLDVSTNLVSGNAVVDTNGNNVTFANSTSGITSFTKQGAGILTLSSTGGSLTPTVNINGGIIQLGNGNNNVPALGFLNGTTTLNFDGGELIANGVKVDLSGVINLSNAGGTFSGSKGSSNYSFNFNGTMNVQSSSDVTLSATDMIAGVNSIFNVDTFPHLIVTGSFIDGTTATQITKTGAGTLELKGTSHTYSGATTISSGALIVGAGALTNSSTSIILNDLTTLTGVDLGTNVSLSVAASASADLSGEDVKIKTLSGSGALALSGIAPVLTVGDGSFSGVISGTASLLKTGNGKLTLSGDNSFTGPVTLAGGTLSVSALGSGGSNSALGAASSDAGNLVFKGGKIEVTGTGEAMARNFTVGNGGAGFLSSGTAALTIGPDVQMDFENTSASNRTLSLGGTSNISARNIFDPTKFDEADISNLFTKLVKQDANKWIVLGAGAGFWDDTQTEIDIQNGELGFDMGSLGSKTSINVGVAASSATLSWEPGNTEDISGRTNLVNGSSDTFNIPTNTTVTFMSSLNAGALSPSTASLTKSGDGTLNLNAKNDFSGNFSITGGIVKAGVAGSVGSGTVNINNATLVVNAVLSNTVIINSGGTLTSDNGNQGVGDTTVMGNGLLVPGGDAIGTMTIRNLTLMAGANINWQITDATGANLNNYSLAGTGYDTFILHSLSLSNASINSRVHVHVKSFSSSPALNFDKTAVQSFQFAKLTTKLSQSDADHITELFEIDATDFEFINGLKTDHLVWRMNVSADREYLYVIAIPEPSTYGLGLGALALAFAAIRRRKLKTKAPVA